MFCPACGNQVPDDAAACPVCGNDLGAARQVAQATAPAQPAVAPAAVPAPATPLAPVPVPPAAPTSRTGLIVAVSIVAVLLVLVVIVAGGFFAFGLFKGGSSRVAGTPAATSSANTTVTAPTGAPTPGAAVDAWFLAVAKGDLAAVRRTATPDFASAIGASMFEGRDPHTSYRIVGTSISGDRATVDVQESPTDAAAQTATTFTLQEQGDGTWLVSQYQVAATGATVGSATGASTQSGATPAAFGKADAIEVVGKVLRGLKIPGGSLKVASAAATARFKDANPGWIQKASDFDFQITGATKQGDAWIVTTSEWWVSGAETGSYTVVVRDGQGYVDRRDGLN